MKHKLAIVLITMQIGCVASYAQLYVQNSASITTTGNAIISLQNTGLQNNGTVSQAATGKFVFSGSSNDSISGSGTTTLDTLEVAKTRGKLLLSQDVRIDHCVLFTTGLIDLNGNNLMLQSTAKLINETETSHITGINGGSVQIGNIIATRLPVLYNAGNLGAAITSSNLGTLAVTRMHQPASNPSSLIKTGIQRTFFIQPQNNTSLNATLRFYYLDAELNGKDESTLAIWKSDDGVNWNMVGADNQDVVNNFVEKSGISNFSYWTLTDAANALPVNLISFKATCETDDALLQWQTATEVNSASFIVQKSTDANIWTNLQSVAASNSANGASYSFKDNAPSASTYYRLKIIDKDGSFNYSPIFNGGCSGAAMPFVVYPNPAHDFATARLSVRQAGNALISVYGINGQLISQHDWTLQIGLNSFELPGMAVLPTGSYVVTVLLNGQKMQTKLVKE